MMQTPHPELQALRSELRDIYNSMTAFGTAQLAAKPPILDSSIGLSGGDANDEFHTHQDALHGLRALRDAVRRDLDVLEKFLNDTKCASSPALSTNAPYLISVWNEVLHAPPPVVTIWHTFLEGDQRAHVPRRGSRKPPGVKIDVVADSGRRWIRVNTTKNSRLIAEFREIDSYLTGSEDEDEGEDGEGRPSLAQAEFDNSIIRMGRTLLDAARRNPLPGTTAVPSITIRLTRLDPSPSEPNEYDPRITRTIDELRDMGIEVELGERDPTQLPKVSPSPARRLEPTVCINLDLSVLIALVSDITHSPLPVSAAEARKRYVPSTYYREWKRKRLEASKQPEEEIDESRMGENGIGKHSRALTNQALQEMGRGLLQELHDRLIAVSCGRLENVEFWTTPEARDRCLRIVLSKIGGPNEKRRAAALFPPEDTPLSLSEAETSYWSESRYPRAFLPLVPIRVFASSVPPSDQALRPVSDDPCVLSPFFTLLARTACDILAQETVPQLAARSSSSSGSGSGSGSAPRDGEDELDDSEIERAVVTKANPRLTAHTVQSMLWGAAREWTTLTANKASVKAILRDMKAAEGGYGGWGGGAVPGVSGAGQTQVHLGSKGSGEEAVVEKAALWVVDPRSLAEGMRSDYCE